MAISFSSPSTSKLVVPYAGNPTSFGIAFSFRRRGTGGGALGRLWSRCASATGAESYCFRWDSTRFSFEIFNSSGTAMTKFSFDAVQATNTDYSCVIRAAWNGSNLLTTLYANGTAYSPAIGSLASTGWRVPGVIILGNRGDNTRNADADLWEFGFYDRAPDVDECTELSQGLSPANVRRGLAAYLPLLGPAAQLPVNLVGEPGTLSGGAAAPHGRIFQ